MGSIAMGPNLALTLLIFGALSVYCELIWPGRVVPGVAGVAVALAGAYSLFREPVEPAGLACLGLGGALLIAETLWGPCYRLGILGSVALTAGFAMLRPDRIALGLAIPLALVFSAASAVLACSAKRARRNKWADIGRER